MTRSKSIKHPSDEALERYALGQVTGLEEYEIEVHLLTCERCRTALTAHDTTIESIRLIWCEPRFHVTEQGIVRIWVDQHEGLWVGHVEGSAFSKRVDAARPGAAMALASQEFKAAFPRHVCGEACHDPSVERAFRVGL